MKLTDVDSARIQAVFDTDGAGLPDAPSSVFVALKAAHDAVAGAKREESTLRRRLAEIATEAAKAQGRGEALAEVLASLLRDCPF